MDSQIGATNQIIDSSLSGTFNSVSIIKNGTYLTQTNRMFSPNQDPTPESSNVHHFPAQTHLYPDSHFTTSSVGITYSARYLGRISVHGSLQPLNYDQRSCLLQECIGRVRDAIQLAKNKVFLQKVTSSHPKFGPRIV